MTIFRKAIGVVALALVLERESLADDRPRFEPTDVGLEKPGTLEIDMQVGAFYGDGPGGARLSVLDFEIDLGLAPRVELDVDGAFGVNNIDSRAPAVVGEALWTSVKLGLFGKPNATRTSEITLVGQLGPRIATVSGYGVGYEGILILGLLEGRLRLAFQGGVILDPGPARGTVRPFSLVSGADLALELDGSKRWSLLSELAVGYFPAVFPNEITLTAGFGFSPSRSVAFSVIALGGFVPGADRLGLLFGVAPKTSLW